MNEFTVARRLNADRDRVWAVLTQPASFERWLPAKPGSAVLDVRTGGSWQATVTAADGKEIALNGAYIDVQAAERLVMTVPGGVVSDLSLRAEADDTTTAIYRFSDLQESMHAMVTESVDEVIGRISQVLEPALGETMRALSVGQYIALDGVVEGLERWHFQYQSPEMTQAVLDQISSSDTLLLGRKTYETFAGAFAQAAATDPIATALTAVHKIVASTTLTSVDWKNSSVISGDVIAEAGKLKTQPGGRIVVNGSITLVKGLLAADLVDELFLIVHPVVAGTGRRLFDDGYQATWELVSSTIWPNGVLANTYRHA